MKSSLVLFIALFTTSILFAQGKEPTFEKENGLVKATYYHDNGQIKEVGYFKGEKLHKSWVSYNEDGEKVTVANYNLGKKEGTWYMMQNDTVKVLTYKNNKLIQVENSEYKDLNFI